MPNGLFEITFTSTAELIKLAEQQEKLLRLNVETAVYKTMLFAIAKIAGDTPVDTGRLRASIAGEYANEAGVDIPHGKKTEGKSASVTKFVKSQMMAVVGTNVEYAIWVEYGHKTGGHRKLTRKQIAYLIATGVLKPDGKGGLTFASVNARINQRAGTSGGRVKGKGFFRKNIPIIQRYMDSQMAEAMQATAEGRLLRAA